MMRDEDAHWMAVRARADAAAVALAVAPIRGVTVTVEAVEVRVPGRARPVLRVVNPPGLAVDPAGEVTLHGRARPGKTAAARRYRVDPAAALAEVLAGRDGGRGR